MAYTFPKIDTNICDILCDENKFIIWGTGKIARLTLKKIKEYGSKVVAFCDNDENMQGKFLENIIVLSPKEISSLKAVVVIASRYVEAIEKQLTEMRIKNYIKAALLFSGSSFENETCLNNMHALSKMKKQIVLEKFPSNEAVLLDSVDIVITEKCSLRCRDCANLMQYYANPMHEDLEVVAEALDKLMKAVDFIFEIRILGGEPYMNPRLNEYIELLDKYENFGDIIVYTNGTIVPKGKNLECLKRDNLFLSISDYGEVSINLKPIEVLLKKEKILYDIKKINEWQDCGKIKNYNRNEHELLEVYKECCCNKTLSLRHGKLFGCPFSGNANVLGAIHEYKEDLVDIKSIEDIEIIRKEIKDLLSRNFYFACKYCGGRPLTGNEIEPAIQSDKIMTWEMEE